MPREVEVKIAIDDVSGSASRIEALGGELVLPRHFEDNCLFDTEHSSLATTGRILRVRQAVGRCVVTSKSGEPSNEASRYKIRTEIEVIVDDAAAIRALLESVGFRVRWRYQKYRRAYRWEGATVVLDETPHGAYWEIEGEPASIDRAAARLGFSARDYITETYWELHRRACEREGLPIGDMVYE